MFKHSVIANYCCASCEQVKPKCVLIYIATPLQNIIIGICPDCLETLAGTTKPINVAEFPGLNMIKSGKTDTVVEHLDKFGYFRSANN